MESRRFALPERFNLVLQRVIATTGANYISLRRWQPYVIASANQRKWLGWWLRNWQHDRRRRTSSDRRDAIANRSEAGQVGDYPSQEELLAELTHPDWERRLKAIQKIEVNNETFFAVVAALDHERVLSDAGLLLSSAAVCPKLEPLCKVVLPTQALRRTAGDALSDRMHGRAGRCAALEDRSKLMRWRAARFLNEVGDQAAVEPATCPAAREFDVRVEMLAASSVLVGGSSNAYVDAHRQGC